MLQVDGADDGTGDPGMSVGKIQRALDGVLFVISFVILAFGGRLCFRPNGRRIMADMAAGENLF